MLLYLHACSWIICFDVVVVVLVVVVVERTD